MTNDGEMGGMALHGRQWQQEPRRDDDNEDKVTLQSLRASATALKRFLKLIQSCSRRNSLEGRLHVGKIPVRVANDAFC